MAEPPGKISTYLKDIGVDEGVIQRFENEKVDETTVHLMSDEQLKELGLAALGHRIKLRDLCTRRKKMGNENDMGEKLQKLRDLIGSKGKSRKGKTPLQPNAATSKKQRVKDNLRFEFGWKHWGSGRFTQKKMQHGGGNRSWDVPRYATLDDCLDIAKNLFFPAGKSPEGNSNEMSLALGNYSGEILGDLEENGELRSFNAERYKRVTGLNRPRLYLLSRSMDDCDDDMSSDELNHSPFDDSGETSPSNGQVTPTRDSEEKDTDEENDFKSQSEKQSTSLIGTSEERSTFYAELEEQVLQSEMMDREKEERKKMERELIRKKADDAIRLARDESEELEKLRRRRELRVPCAPEDDEEYAVVCVRHPVLGTVNRKFKKDSTMHMVYDWVGSLNLTPKYFNLSILPGKPIYPDENVLPFSEMTLSMIEQDDPLPLSSSDNEVSFYDGKDEPEKLDDTVVESSGIFEDKYDLFPVDAEPPDILLSGDGACAVVTLEESYQDLEARRKQERENLQETLYVEISRNEVVTELCQLYEDNEILEKNIIPTFHQEGHVAGDGVLMELFSLFWENFVAENCDGSSQFALRVLPQMSDKFVAVGRIITHQFLQCGSFPVQLARASVHHMLFNKVSEDCLLDSFLQLLPPRQREVFAGALQGQRPFPLDEVIDVLDDHNVKTLPSPENLRGIVLKIAATEFVEKPFLPLLKIREGIGRFWDGISQQSIDAVYQLCNVTPSTMIDHLHCVPLDRAKN